MRSKSNPKKENKPPTSLEVFESKRAELGAVAPRATRTRVDSLVGEARLLAEVARRHRAALLAIGVPAAVLDSLDERATTVEGAQLAQRQLARGKGAEELATTQQATQLRAEILRAVRFAMRHDPAVLRRVEAIHEGTGPDDLVADLVACAELCDAHGPQLEDVQVDPFALAQACRALHAGLSANLRDRRLRSVTALQHTDTRDRAVAHLLDAMTEVRAAGLFLFRNEPQEARAFRSIQVRRPAPKRKAAAAAAE